LKKNLVGSPRFETANGYTVTGVEGLGSEYVVDKAIDRQGRARARKITKDHLGFHIKEKPLLCSSRNVCPFGTQDGW
jgi:hypothetical protein